MALVCWELSMILHFKRCRVAAAVEEGIWKCEAGQKATAESRKLMRAQPLHRQRGIHGGNGPGNWRASWKGKQWEMNPGAQRMQIPPERLACPGGGHLTFGGQAGRTEVGVGKL